MMLVLYTIGTILFLCVCVLPCWLKVFFWSISCTVDYFQLLIFYSPIRALSHRKIALSIRFLYHIVVVLLLISSMAYQCIITFAIHTIVPAIFSWTRFFCYRMPCALRKSAGHKYVDQVPTGAMVYALGTELEAHNASFLSVGISSMLALQMTSGSSMKALSCSFRGWTGSYVVLTGGVLEMDMCDFRGR